MRGVRSAQWLKINEVAPGTRGTTERRTTNERCFPIFIQVENSYFYYQSINL